MTRTEGGHQANGHIESNGKASEPPRPCPGQMHGLMLSASDIEGWQTRAFCWGFLALPCACC